jgi:ATP-dependent helicase/nuclease subunit B
MAGDVYTIPSDVPFLSALAKGVLARYGTVPETLAAVTVLLPNRRSVRAFKDALITAAGKPMLLPAIHSIGDVEEDELSLVLASADLPPAVTHSQRLLLLAGLIEAWAKNNPTEQANNYITADQAVKLAHALGALLDDMQREGLSFDLLEKIVPEELAKHWGITIEFLKIVSENWPKILAEKNVMDAVARRNELLKMQAVLWRASPPKAPVIAAGTTGSIPATRALLGALLSLENGMVVLPGLDTEMPEKEWRHVPQNHPQAGMKHLLEDLNIPRSAVKVWGSTQAKTSARVALLRETLRPSDTTDAWREVKLLPAAVENLSILSFATQQKEAEAIAVMLRETLEKPEATACLITTDRKLAQRVSSLMLRWGAEVNDSAGQPLAELPVLSFLRLLALAAERRFSPVALLSFLKHPLASGGMNTGAFRSKVRALEKSVLRGVTPAAGLHGIRALLNEDGKRLLPWFEALAKKCTPLVVSKEKAKLSDMIRAHIEVAEALAATEGEKGAVVLWSGDEGAHAAAFVDEALKAAEEYGDIDPLHYLGVLDALLIGKVYRPRYGGHPRIAILSPMEARLQQFDRVILASMNQGSWPRSSTNPWMSRSMAESCGLPGEARLTSLAAHDFSSFVMAPEVVITRAEKVDGAPSIPSMFLLRLNAVIAGSGLEVTKPAWPYWAESIFASSVVAAPLTPPMPKPPVAARPRELSVTTVEKLMRDPYAVYASKILRLRPLDPLEQDPGAADFGNFIHKALELFTKQHGQKMEKDAAWKALIACGKEAFTPLENHPSVYAMWWPRFEKVAEWLVQYEEERGSHVLAVAGEEYTITAKADRVEADSEGSATIIDYKTGTLPTKAHVEAGFSPQLMLEGMIALAGGFEGWPEVNEIKGLEYWKTGVGADLGHVPKPMDYDPSAVEGLKQLIAFFTSPDAPYLACPNPKYTPTYNDFDHLERNKEWM